MNSRWFGLKPKALSLRRRGKSIRYIEAHLGIPRSTLSGWFRNIKLTRLQYKVLNEKHRESLVKARKIAVTWHNKQKSDRLKFAENEATKTLLKIPRKNEIVELALALLYLGEGFKKSPRTGMGNSDPLLLKFFLKTVTTIYKLDIKKIKFDIHIRADQNSNLIKKYWAHELDVPIKQFRHTATDKRTSGRKTYADHKGVCVIDCGHIAIQRKLVYIGKKFCKEIAENLRG